MGDIVLLRRGTSFGPNVQLVIFLTKAWKRNEEQLAHYAKQKELTLSLKAQNVSTLLSLAITYVQEHIADTTPMKPAWLLIRSAALEHHVVAEGNEFLRALAASPGIFRVELEK